MTRNFLEFADTVPGVVFEVDAKGRTSIRGGAQNDNGVNLYIDGVGQKGYVRSGVSAARPATRRAIRSRSSPSANTRSSLPTTRRSTTRSRARPSPRSRVRAPTSSRARPSARTPPTTCARRRRPSIDTGTQDGVRDQGIRRRLRRTRSSRTGCTSSSPTKRKRYVTPVTVTADHSPPRRRRSRNLPPDALAQLGPATIGFDEDLFFAKLDWALSDVDRFDLSAKIREETAMATSTGTGVGAVGRRRHRQRRQALRAALEAQRRRLAQRSAGSPTKTRSSCRTSQRRT